jgi:hypothetical protein
MNFSCRPKKKLNLISGSWNKINDKNWIRIVIQLIYQYLGILSISQGVREICTPEVFLILTEAIGRDTL